MTKLNDHTFINFRRVGRASLAALAVAVMASSLATANAGNSKDSPGKITKATTITIKKNKGKISGNIKKGQVVDLKWAEKSSVACFPGTQFKHFDGRHVLYKVEMPAHTKFTITATPKKSTTDISLYAIRVGQGGVAYPPDITSVISCEADYASNSYSNPFNPGDSETVVLTAPTKAYTLYIGVAGANKAKRGGFKLEVSSQPY